MKIRNIAIIILMTICFIILGTKVYASTGTILEDVVKLRKSPDSKTVLDLVNKGDKVEILEEQNGWYKVKATTSLGKVTGYITKESAEVENNNVDNSQNPEVSTDVPVKDNIETSVETQTEIPDTNETISTDIIEKNPVPTVSNNMENGKQYTLTQEINIKILPLINSIEKAKISGNIHIIEILNDWARIENDTQIGWVRLNKLKQSITDTEVTQEQPTQEAPVVGTPVEQPPIQETPVQETETPKEEKPVTEQPKEEQQPEVTIINKIGYISAEGLRVRKGPSTDTEEITSLSKNDEVKIIGQTGKWYKIELNGKEGYVSSKYISDTKLPETTSRGGNTIEQPEITVQDTTNVEQPKVEETPKAEEVTAQPEAPATSTTGAAIVEYAKQYLGYKYVSGGASPSKGFDCSGFTQYVYKHFGISINRTSGAQIKNGVAVERANLQPGDLVIFNNDANTKIGHVGIYIGDGNFIHASNPSDGVKITTLTSGYYHQRYVGARRVH